MLKVRLNTIASCLFFPNLSTFLCNLHFIALSNNECLAQNNPVSFCNLTRWHTCDLFISAHTRQLWSRVHTILFNFHLNLATTADSNVYAHSISVTIIPISRTVSFQLYMKGLALLLWLFRFPPSFSKSHSKSIDSDVHLVNFIFWAHRLLKGKGIKSKQVITQNIGLKSRFDLHVTTYIDGVIVGMLATSVVDCVFEPQSGKTKNYKIGICCFSAKHSFKD
jgi:hypothetical protein